MSPLPARSESPAVEVLSRSNSHLGAYGFRLDYQDADDPPPDLIELDSSAPLVTVDWRHASTITDVEEVTEDRVAYGFRGATIYHVERDPPAIRFDIPYIPIRAALVHPLLTVGVSILARWRGNATLHAGAFETPSGAWAIMGGREAGKSSILASLAQRGHSVVADDLLITDDGSVWAGPSCVDLRPDTAGRFADARPLGIIGGRPRFRLSTLPGRARLPVAGFFVLDWHEQPGVLVESLPAQERLHWIYRQEYIRLVGYPDPQKLMPLLGLPAWRVTRPRDWKATEEVIDRVLEIAG